MDRPTAGKTTMSPPMGGNL